MMIRFTLLPTDDAMDDQQAQPPHATPPDEPPRPLLTPDSDDAYQPGLSRKVLFGVLGVMALIFALGSAWIGYQYAGTSAIARLGESVAAPAAPAATVPAHVAATPAPPPPMASAPVAPPNGVSAGPSAPPTLPSAEELLADKKRPAAPSPAPAALVRDLPDWLATEVGGRVPAKAASAASSAETSGGSAASGSSGASDDEPVARQETARGKRGERPASTERQLRASSVFARCPKPGDSGAVECRRAVCSGAARKQGACAAYLN